MKEPTKQSIPLPYGEGEALQPFFQQLQDQYQLFMDHHQKVQDRYRGLVEHHTLLGPLLIAMAAFVETMHESSQVAITLK
jgi:hypothetical protein